MSEMQVLNSTAKNGLHVFRKNQNKLMEVKPEATTRSLQSLKGFIHGLDIDEGRKAVVTKRGKFTSFGKEQLKRLLKNCNLPTTATWQDVCDQIVKRATNLAKEVPAAIKVLKV